MVVRADAEASIHLCARVGAVEGRAWMRTSETQRNKRPNPSESSDVKVLHVFPP